MRKIRPLALADGFKPGSLRRQVQTANAGKQAQVGQCSVDLVGHLLILGVRKPALLQAGFRVSFIWKFCVLLALFEQIWEIALQSGDQMG